MPILTEDQIKQILNEANKVTALYGGGFKPPTKGHFEVVEKALKESGNNDVTVKIFPGLNHLFQNATTGAGSEYFEIEETIAPVVLETMATWINKRF